MGDLCVLLDVVFDFKVYEWLTLACDRSVEESPRAEETKWE